MSLEDKIGKYWSDREKQNKTERNLKLKWWQDSHIISRINQWVSGEYKNGPSQGLNEYLKQHYSQVLPLKTAISVGCGTGKKEMLMMKQGLVEKFDLYEISTHRIEEGQRLAESMGLSQQVKFFKGNAFEMANQKEHYDMVHWNNSLHHMMNVNDAIAWSKKILKLKGIFYMDDYVGPNRLQWTDKMLLIASKVREALPEKYLQDPRNPGKFVNTKLSRPNIAHLIKEDPSEAADAENIVAAVKKYFPDAYIKFTGGVIYHLALSNILHNFEGENDRNILDLLMLMDELCTELGETHYAVAVAQKI